VLYKTLSAAVCGIDASILEVEVDISGIKTSLISDESRPFPHPWACPTRRR
jgi:hypothetical protein